MIYPGDRIRYAPDGGEHSTQLRVTDEGTFGDSHEWEHRHEDDQARNGRRVTIGTVSGGLDAHADLRVQIPAGRRVSLYLAVGRVTVTNVNGDLWIDAASSPVTATGFTGMLDIDVGSGQVQVSQMEGDLSVDTGSGPVELSRVKGRTALGRYRIR